MTAQAGGSQLRGSTEPRVFTPPLRELTPETSLGFACIDFAREIDPAWLDGVETVGITSGASVPEILVKGVVEYLDGEGFHDVKPVTTANETLVFALPRELRPRAKA